jgi:hypothetical protein
VALTDVPVAGKRRLAELNPALDKSKKTRWNEPLNDDASSSSGAKYAVDAKKEKESPERNITAAGALGSIRLGVERCCNALILGLITNINRVGYFAGIIKSSSVGEISAHSSHELRGSIEEATSYVHHDVDESSNQRFDGILFMFPDRQKRVITALTKTKYRNLADLAECVKGRSIESATEFLEAKLELTELGDASALAGVLTHLFIPPSFDTGHLNIVYFWSGISFSSVPVAVNFSFFLDGEYLNVLELPRQFGERYLNIPAKVYVRDCYKKLYEIAATSMVTTRIMEGSASLFTGVPGIGKSLFLVYFVYRFLNDEPFKDKHFALELTYGVYLSYRVDKGIILFLETNRLCSDQNWLLLCDIKQRAEPSRCDRCTYIFSSPDPCRYKETMKSSSSTKYIMMPTWSESELEFVTTDKTNWRENFKIYGGIPWHVLKDTPTSDMAELNEAITTEGPYIAHSFAPWASARSTQLRALWLSTSIHQWVNMVT